MDNTLIIKKPLIRSYANYKTTCSFIKGYEKSDEFETQIRTRVVENSFF